MLKMRKTKTGSGQTAVQVVDYQNRKIVVVQNLGTGHNEQEIAALVQLGNQFILAHSPMSPLWPEIFSTGEERQLVSVELFRPRDHRGRQRFYDVEWNNRRWRGMARVFFSRAVISRLGRDPRFFDYAEGGISGHLLKRAGYALSVLDPAANPYLQWLLLGRHRSARPYALRSENFPSIRANLDRLDLRVQSLEDFIETPEASGLDGFNLSDIFEYMSEANAHRLLEKLIGSGRPGARLVYWNLLAPRRRPDRLAHRLRPLEERLADSLLRRDKAFFYSALNVGWLGRNRAINLPAATPPHPAGR